MTTADYHKEIIPGIDRSWTEESSHRFEHGDIASLSAEEAWAKRHQLTNWLSAVIFAGRRPRLIGVSANDYTTDIEWARERIGRLRAHLSRRVAA